MSKQRLTEKELLQAQQMQILHLDLSSNKLGEEVEELEDMLPCIFHFNNKSDIGMLHLDTVGLEYFDLSPEEAAGGGTDFLETYAHPDIFKLAPQLVNFYEQGDEHAVFSFFQRVRRNADKPFEWLFSTTKIYKKKNTLITLSSFVDKIDHIGHKLNRILDENEFMKKNFLKFAQLTVRERELIGLLAKGYNNPQIAEMLFISRNTVEQHRKNINRKLEIESFAQLLKFAQAFDLI